MYTLCTEVTKLDVKCVLCDQVEELKDNSIEAKKLRNRRMHMYLCSPCNDRITKKTKERHSTGNFQLYRKKPTNNSILKKKHPSH